MASDKRLPSQQLKSEIIRSIRTALLELGRATKAELCQRLQYSFPTISKFLMQMEEAGEVTISGLDESSGGRRAIRYAYNPNYRLGMAIFLEKNETNYTIYNCIGEVIKEGNLPSILEEDVSTLVSLIEDEKKTNPKIQSVAIGVPGAVKHGKIFLIPGYEKYQNLNLKRCIEDQLSIPTIVENDMNAAVIGYMTQKNLKENISLMYLYLGKNGPGAGIAVNGEIVRGKTFFSGEVQFIPQYDNRNFIEALTGDHGGSSMQSDYKVDAISRLVATITSILNPHYIIFCEDELAPALLNQIAECSATYVPKEHLPELAVSDLKCDYLIGLQSLGLGLLVSQQID
ncbi:ROK family transcriptional regulator [Paenibacillus etheri]|uniref:ROK family transcriptional regulator n=1 Tax=Paenibacillus etheri TaxID=1306852 RepID=A0A0W1AXF9_9BACL|nr:ROK family protein [Paenibacillus etheri]KTD85952.1 ROK family transcriptional regulator [Paenibacillus etheri]